MSDSSTDQNDQAKSDSGSSDKTTETIVGNGLKVRCPHCHQPIEILESESLNEVTCSLCGSSFNLLSDTETAGYEPSGGEMIAHFQLMTKLGTGAFGTVWKAKDTTLDRVVALKVPRQSQLPVEDKDKFFREARAAAQLKHDNIVSVHEVGRDGETVFIVSEYIDGVTLSDWITGNQISSIEAMEICERVAVALHHAHQAGVIHRDVKPSNIMLDKDFKPYVMDFGLAKREAGEITMTAEGAILGTPAYMSPEQATGEAHDVDARSDIYSLGVVLFELMTGERPFRGNMRMMIQQVVQDEAPSPRKLNSSISRDLETICLKCLQKDPSKRYSSAEELANDLQRYRSGLPIAARPITPLERSVKWIRKNQLLASLISIVVMLSVFITTLSAYAYFREAKLNETLSGLVNEKTDLVIAETNATRRVQKLNDEKTKLIDELNKTLKVSQSRLTLSYVAYGRVCSLASKIANLDDSVVDKNVRGRQVSEQAMLQYRNDSELLLTTAATPQFVIDEFSVFNNLLQDHNLDQDKLRIQSLKLANVCGRAWRESTSQSPEARLNIQHNLYKQACLAVERMATADDFSKVGHFYNQFWELYWGELAIVESKEVESMMVKIGKEIGNWKSGKPPARLKDLSKQLQTVCEISPDQIEVTSK